MLFALLLAASLGDVSQTNEPPAPLPPPPAPMTTSDDAPQTDPSDAPAAEKPAPPARPPRLPRDPNWTDGAPEPVVVAPSADEVRIDAAIRAALGGGIGTSMGWAIGIGSLFATAGIAPSLGGAGGLFLAAMFFGSPVAIGGLGSFLGALAATRDPTSSLMAGGGGALAVAGTLAAGAVLFSLQPSGDCGPSEEQVLVALATLAATPFAGAAGGALGAFVGAPTGPATADAE